MKYYTVLLFSALFAIASCGGADTPEQSASAQTESVEPEIASSEASSEEEVKSAATEAETPDGPELPYGLPNADGYFELAWEDLMPDGEEKLLSELYQAFFEEQERAWREQQATLADLGGYSTGIAEGSAADVATQIGTFNTVKELDGMKVRIPGYVVPLDFRAEGGHKEFILVPYFGACLHSPPPPPNQTLFIKADPPAEIKSIYEPVWIEGTMSTGEFYTSAANTAYEIALDQIEIYEY
ncbi:MAG: DUF3299 domain-containing protein [Pseudomonadota bacterium]